MLISPVSSTSNSAASVRNTLSTSTQLGLLHSKLKNLAEKLEKTSATGAEKEQAEQLVRAQVNNVITQIKSLQEQQNLQNTQPQQVTVQSSAQVSSSAASRDDTQDSTSSQRVNYTALGQNVDTYA
jgi:DNA-binding protein H-NS